MLRTERLQIVSHEAVRMLQAYLCSHRSFLLLTIMFGNWGLNEASIRAKEHRDTQDMLRPTHTHTLTHAHTLACYWSSGFSLPQRSVQATEQPKSKQACSFWKVSREGRVAHSAYLHANDKHGRAPAGLHQHLQKPPLGFLSLLLSCKSSVSSPPRNTGWSTFVYLSDSQQWALFFPEFLCN